ARVAVAPGLEIEARDRDEQDCEVGLGHHAPEDRADRVGEEVGHRGEDHARDQGLAGDRALLAAPAVADYVTERRDRKAHRWDDVVLAVDRDTEASDAEPQVDEDATREGLLDRGRGQQPRQLHLGGQPRPARSTSMSLWSATWSAAAGSGGLGSRKMPRFWTPGGSNSRTMSSPRRAVVRQWMRRSGSPGWYGRTPNTSVP